MPVDCEVREVLAVCSALNSDVKQLKGLQTGSLLKLDGKCLDREGKLITRDLVTVLGRCGWN